MEWFQIVMSVLLIAIPAFFAWINRLKATAQRAELLETVRAEIEAEIKPIRDKQNRQDDLYIDMAKQVDRIEIRMDSILEALEKAPEQMEKGFTKLESNINRIDDIYRSGMSDLRTELAAKQDKIG